MYYEAERTAPATYMGTVLEVTDDGKAVIEQKNKFFAGDTLELITPKGDNRDVKVLSIEDENGNEMESCPHPKQRLLLRTDVRLNAYDILRK